MVLEPPPDYGSDTSSASSGHRLAGATTGVVDEPAPALLLPGFATGIGSMPHHDAHRAARTVLRLHPELPAAPQLPMRSGHEGVLAQWLSALPEISVAADATSQLDEGRADAPIQPKISAETHAGFIAFVEAASSADPPVRRAKAQLTGPLTLGLALVELGMDVNRAFERAGELVTHWVSEIETYLVERLPAASLLVFLDEPGLVAWRRDDAPIHRDEATDRLSTALASVTGTNGVHVCTGGDVGIACAAGPTVVGLDVGDDLIDVAVPLDRHLDGGGWVAWGAVPTHRPVGDSPEPLWRRLVEQWCELTRRGIDPLALRSLALLTPACGLAGHGETQSERALTLAREIGRRVGDQAAATRLTIGA